MASTSEDRYLRNSSDSKTSMWEKLHQLRSKSEKTAPFAQNEDDDQLSDAESLIEDQDTDISQGTTPSDEEHLLTSISNLNIKERKPWEGSTDQDFLKIVFKDDQNTDVTLRSIKTYFSQHGLEWTPNEETLCSSYFGLKAIKIHFNRHRSINIPRLCLSSSVPYWTRLKREEYQAINNSNQEIGNKRFELNPEWEISLRYGALVELDKFVYSKTHAWYQDQNHRDNNTRWVLALNNRGRENDFIEWTISDNRETKKKQLFISNIDHGVIVVLKEHGFEMYICQHCNISEFKVQINANNQTDYFGGHGNRRRERLSSWHGPRKTLPSGNSPRKRSSSRYGPKGSLPSGNSPKERSSSRYGPKGSLPSGNSPREKCLVEVEGQPSNERIKQSKNQKHNILPPAPLIAPKTRRPEAQQRQRDSNRIQRIGDKNGCYFSTIQFSITTPSTALIRNRDDVEKFRKQILSELIDFFLSHRIRVYYANVHSNEGSPPYLFFQEKLPAFPSLIMKYSWQLLSVVGYRLQNQINNTFMATLNDLTKEFNAGELFYQVCVYLSRALKLRPFNDPNAELTEAIHQLKQKRDNAAYGLQRKIDIEDNIEAYIPSVSLTPTTIRIKPLKLCRTSRVLRAVQEFGRPTYHFALVDIREENGRPLQSYHFRDLRSHILHYLEEGFTLMNDNRMYKYLHHSQSQLRARQFWFYYHNDNKFNDEESNLSFAEAYTWMGTFDKEKNPAKYAARMALCFTTTTPTVTVPENYVEVIPDIEVTVKGKKLSFTDGCGTMSVGLRDNIMESLGTRKTFSAVQFRYNGVKGVVSVDPYLLDSIRLRFRDSMKKFDSDHYCFEVCKRSSPRKTFLNRQAIMLLSYRKVPDLIFHILQQQDHLNLIRCLLINSDAEKLILNTVPPWFLPRDIHLACIDYIHEPFFRVLLINACLRATRDLLQRARIQVPLNLGRNMFGIVDEYRVLKPNEVFIQYTIYDGDRLVNKTEILDQRKVVITKNPCHHPGDIRTFMAVDHEKLRHLKDVVVFSQQGDRPAPHDISGSDLDGDEYLVVWHKDLVPDKTENAEPFDYDANIPLNECRPPITRNIINDTVLDIAENDYLGRLSQIHLAFADRYGLESTVEPKPNVPSTVQLAGYISLEVDSPKTGYHPVNEADLKKINLALENKRPDYMEATSFDSYESSNILGQLYRATQKTLPKWNKLIRYQRHLQHLQVRVRHELENDDDEDKSSIEIGGITIQPDTSLTTGVDRQHDGYKSCVPFVQSLHSLYRQEILEILNLYGLSHESDLWCRNTINSATGELEDTANRELEQLVSRTRTHVFNELVTICETGRCHDDTAIDLLCLTCRKGKQAMAVACYYASYDDQYTKEQAPILSLPWIFSTALLQSRFQSKPSPSKGLLWICIEKACDHLLMQKRNLHLTGQTLRFQSTNGDVHTGTADVELTVCLFIEVLHAHIKHKKHDHWLRVISHFVQQTPSFALTESQASSTNDDWILILEAHRVRPDNLYAGMLCSLCWTKEAENLILGYFECIINICFDKARETQDFRYLHISENIISLLRNMAIDEAILDGEH